MKEAQGNRPTPLSSSPLRPLRLCVLCEMNWKQSVPQSLDPSPKVIYPIIALYLKAYTLINLAGGDIGFLDKQ